MIDSHPIYFQPIDVEHAMRRWPIRGRGAVFESREGLCRREQLVLSRVLTFYILSKQELPPGSISHGNARFGKCISFLLKQSFSFLFIFKASS